MDAKEDSPIPPPLDDDDEDDPNVTITFSTDAEIHEAMGLPSHPPNLTPVNILPTEPPLKWVG
jgi:hypothetical protein